LSLQNCARFPNSELNLFHLSTKNRSALTNTETNSAIARRSTTQSIPTLDVGRGMYFWSPLANFQSRPTLIVSRFLRQDSAFLPVSPRLDSPAIEMLLSQL